MEGDQFKTALIAFLAGAFLGFVGTKAMDRRRQSAATAGR